METDEPYTSELTPFALVTARPAACRRDHRPVTLDGAPGPVQHVKIVCVRRHWYTLPVDGFPGNSPATDQADGPSIAHRRCLSELRQPRQPSWRTRDGTYGSPRDDHATPAADARSCHGCRQPRQRRCRQVTTGSRLRASRTDDEGRSCGGARLVVRHLLCLRQEHLGHANFPALRADRASRPLHSAAMTPPSRSEPRDPR
jgi:hypothetical protein